MGPSLRRALEGEMDRLLARMLGLWAEETLNEWIVSGRYVSGREMAAAGLAELVDPWTYQPPKGTRVPTMHKSTNGKRVTPAPARRQRSSY